MKIQAAIAGLLSLTGLTSAADLSWHDLAITAPQYGRYLTRTASNEPFFWQADTAWELIHRLNKTSIDFYLKTRAEQGYNVVQTVLVSELDGTTRASFYGDLPFNNSDPTKPNEAYLELVDWTVDLAASYGILMALVPTWGMYVNGGWHSTERIFNESNAYEWGQFIGERYPGLPKILGGDSTVVWSRNMSAVQSAYAEDPGQDLPSLLALIEDTSSVWARMLAGLKDSESSQGYESVVLYHPAAAWVVKPEITPEAYGHNCSTNMEHQQDAAPSPPPPRTPRKRRLSADASSDKKRRASSSPSSPRDATLRIVTQTLRDENRQLQQEREALEQDKRALSERLARSQRSLRDLEEDVARVYRQKQQELEAQRRAFEQKLQAGPIPAEIQASKQLNSAALHSQQTTQEMDRFLASCELWQRKLAALDAELAAKARKMETQEVQHVMAALVGGVEVDTLQDELQDRQEQLQWARWMQTDAASCLKQLHGCAHETEVFEAMEKQLMVDRVVELETQLAQKRAVEREKEMELSSLRADQEELLHSSHVVPNDEFEALLEQKKAMEQQLKQLKDKLKTQGEEMARTEDERTSLKQHNQKLLEETHERTSLKQHNQKLLEETHERTSLKQHNQKLLEETRQLREKQETREFEGIQLSMTQDEEIKKLQAQLLAAKTREEKMEAAVTAAKREIEKVKKRKGELKILYAKFSSAMDSVSEKTMRLEELGQELEDAKNNARAIEARNKGLEQELQDLKSSARGVESQNQKLEKQVSELQQQVAGLSAAQQREKSVNKELLKVQKQCAELRELESQQKELVSKLQAELAALKAQNEALKEQQVKMEHQSVGQPSIEGDKCSRDSSAALAVQVAEKEALQMFVQRYSSAAEAKCNQLLEKVSELQSAKSSIQEQTKETCSVLRMCTQVDSCDESIRASLLDVIATLEGLT